MDKSDSEMTPDERLAWLRERGIEVTTPEERRASSIAQALRDAEALETAALASSSQVSYVMIPADTSKPLQELTFSPSTDAVGDALLQHLKPVFATSTNSTTGASSTVDLSLLQQSTTTTLASSISTTTNDNNDPALKVSEETLRQVAAEGHVEVFCLVHPVPSNQFTAINIYLDEIGMLKRLPLNTRASEYAKRAGFDPPPVFYGNVYLGRIKQQQQQQSGHGLKNLSMVLGPDTAMDAPWLLNAAQENLQYQLEKNRMLSATAEQQPPLAGQDGKDKVEEGYSWTQTEQEIEIKVTLTGTVSKTDIKVQFQPTIIQVSRQNEIVLRIHLFERIDVDSCTWTLENTTGTHNTNTEKVLVISMEKLETAFWPRIQD